MTNPGEDSGETTPSDATGGASEPTPVEQAPHQSTEPPSEAQDQPGYPPPAFSPPYEQYQGPPSYDPTSAYPSGPAGYPPPGGYPPPPQYPTYPPPPPYGAPPPYGTPPPGYPASGYGGAYSAPGQKVNGMAIGSLVAAVVGVVPFLCGIGSIIGIVLGIIALNQIKTSGEGGRGMAIAGIAIGAVTFLISVVTGIAFLST